MLGTPNPKGEPMGQNRQRDGLLVKIDNLIDDAKYFDTGNFSKSVGRPEKVRDKSKSLCYAQGP
jgi:hypothetical protein